MHRVKSNRKKSLVCHGNRKDSFVYVDDLFFPVTFVDLRVCVSKERRSSFIAQWMLRIVFTIDQNRSTPFYFLTINAKKYISFIK